MKPPQPPRHNRPLRDDAKWACGKAHFESVMKQEVGWGVFHDKAIAEACYYISTVSTLPTRAGAVKRALRAEAKKRGIVP